MRIKGEGDISDTINVYEELVLQSQKKFQLLYFVNVLQFIYLDSVPVSHVFLFPLFLYSQAVVSVWRNYFIAFTLEHSCTTLWERP